MESISLTFVLSKHIHETKAHLYNAAQLPLCCDVSCGPQAATDSRKSSGSNGFNCGGI